jgi:hypothetical protein
MRYECESLHICGENGIPCSQTNPLSMMGPIVRCRDFLMVGGNSLKLIRFLLWVVLSLVLVVVADQLMLKRHFSTPVLMQAQTFYRDFRARLLTLGRTDDFADRIGQTIEAEMETPAAGTTARYLYVDAAGVLHFADSLNEVPPAYRQGAQRLAD